MELRHLRYFVAVAEMENVSRAALKLHVSQPALSRQIRDLEDEIGFPLFERTAKTVKLTQAGRAFLNDSRALLHQVDEVVKKARAIANAQPTELHVGYSPSAVAHFLPNALRTFQQALPKVHLRLHDLGFETILDRLRAGQLDLGLIIRPAKATSLHDLRYEELSRERVCLVVALQHPFARRKSVSLVEAAGQPMIGLTREDYPGYFDYLSAIFAKVKEKPRVVEEHDSMAGIISSIEAGNGVGLAAEAFGYSFGTRVKLLPLTPEPKPVSIGIAVPKGKLGMATQCFWQCAKEAARK